ncbi:MAG: hypothetical protein EBX47_03935 [Synechococcaceae bacterium WB8_1B_057]|nr:hypothetical protein [Synechococcaceae bacterium WB8_1B_057]
MQASGSGVLELVRDRQGNRELKELQAAFKKQPEVIFTEPNQEVYIQLISNDPSINSMWGMQATGFGIKAVSAWDKNLVGSSKVVTGVVDTGIDYTHKDLYLNVWLNQGELKNLSFFGNLKDVNNDGLIGFRDLNDSQNLGNSSTKLVDWNKNGYIDAGDLLDNRSGWEDGKDNDSNGYIDDLIGWDFANNDNDPFDDNGHGTHVAGTIGAMGGNAIGVTGINWQTQMVPLKFMSSNGSGSLLSAVAAIDYFTTAKIQAQARGESSRFVSTNNSWGGGGYSQSLANSIQRANDQGLLFVAAAGNGGNDGIGDNNDVIANYPSNYSNNNVIAVGSITSSGALSSFSNYGLVNVDVAAPGSSILSTLPGNKYGSLSGTSMATPHVAGALALLAAAAPQATGAQLKEAVLNSTAATQSLAAKTVSGGRLDISAALAKLQNSPDPNPVTNLTLWGTNGSDIITGGNGNDSITGVLKTGTNVNALGFGQIDVLTGGAGQDTFLLGDSRGIFYNDYKNNNLGKADYALIKDFNLADDKLQLKSGSYLYSTSNGSLSLYWDRNNNGSLNITGNDQDELIAVLNNITGLSNNNINWV